MTPALSLLSQLTAYNKSQSAEELYQMRRKDGRSEAVMERLKLTPELMARLDACGIRDNTYAKYKEVLGERGEDLPVRRLMAILQAHRSAVCKQLDKLESHGFVKKIETDGKENLWRWIG